jgi:hypothetical protein
MKYRGDNDGYKKGALGKFDKGAKLDRNYDPWNPRLLTDDLNPAADAAAKYSANDDAGLREGKTDAENYPKVDIWDLAESQSDRTGPVRLRKRDQE